MVLVQSHRATAGCRRRRRGWMASRQPIVVTAVCPCRENRSALPFAATEQIALRIHFKTVGHAIGLGDKHPLVRKNSVLADIIRAHVSLIRVRHVKRLAIRTESETVRSRL